MQVQRRLIHPVAMLSATERQTHGERTTATFNTLDGGRAVVQLDQLTRACQAEPFSDAADDIRAPIGPVEDPG
jgi:hypothetical protein